jgi:hypothetical protein
MEFVVFGRWGDEVVAGWLAVWNFEVFWWWWARIHGSE